MLKLFNEYTDDELVDYIVSKGAVPGEPGTRFKQAMHLSLDAAKCTLSTQVHQREDGETLSVLEFDGCASRNAPPADPMKFNPADVYCRTMYNAIRVDYIKEYLRYFVDDHIATARSNGVKALGVTTLDISDEYALSTFAGCNTVPLYDTTSKKWLVDNNWILCNFEWLYILSISKTFKKEVQRGS